MPIPDPPWKQRTRPCPFYSQGRCLFADSCNFLHDAKIKVKIQQPEDIPLRTPDSPNATFISHISSPPEAHSPAPTEISRARSPRLSSLLMALGDAICTEDRDLTVHAALPSSSASPPPSLLPVKDAEVSNEDDELISASSSYVMHSLDLEDSALEEREDAHKSDFCGPLPTSPEPVKEQDQLGSLTHREDSIDSGYADGWTGPSPLTLSPPRTPKRHSTFDLLSSPFHSTFHHVLSPPFVPSVAASWPAFPLVSPTSISSHSRSASQVIHTLSDDLDSPTQYRRQLGPEPEDDVSPDPDPEATVKPVASPNLHDERFEELSSTNDEQPEDLSEGPDSSMADRFVSRDQPPVSQPVVYASPKPVSRKHKPSSLTLDTKLLDRSPLTAVNLPLTADDESPADAQVLSSGFAQEISPFCKGESSVIPDRSHLEDVQYETPHLIGLNLGPSPLHSNPPPETGRVVSTPVPQARTPVFSPPHASSSGSPEPVVTSRSSLQIDTSPVLHRGHVARASSASQAIFPSVAAYPSRSPDVPAQSAPAWVRSQSPASDFTPHTKRWEAHSSSSTKVPFGFRHSVGVRSRNSSSFVPVRGASGVPSIHYNAPRRPESALSHSRPTIDFTKNSRFSPESGRVSSPSRLRPLRLSTILNSSSVHSQSSSGFLPSLTTATTASSYTPMSPTVSSDYSMSNNRLLSSPQVSCIPEFARNTLSSGQHFSPTDYIPHSAPPSRPPSWYDSDQCIDIGPAPLVAYPSSHIRRLSLRPSSRMSEPLVPLNEDEEAMLENHHHSHLSADLDDTIRGEAISPHSRTIPSRQSSSLRSPIHAIATPKPTLLFAIASDDVNEVRRVLESGEAGPNDDVGPQSALAFALTANNLTRKMEMVKLLLAHGANPSTLRDPEMDLTNVTSPRSSSEMPPMAAVLESMDPATRYYIARAEAPLTRRASALVHRSSFRPLTKVRYDLIGQDRALEQLFRVLSMPSFAPIVVLFCGPSGHGKSLLARKFGSLLDVPTHTVNMTTLRSTHDIWRSYSMSPYEETSPTTLAAFLMENEGKRCVVVLDEIEKTEDEKYLSSLLMPWELGRCSFEAGHRHVDVSKVIWLGTSNIGHDLVFEHQASREECDEPMSREEYVDLMRLFRPQVSDRLGPSLLSRVTTVLPFVPFTQDEKMAIATEALYSLAGDDARALPSVTVEKLVQNSVEEYVPSEGARSLYRSVSTQLLDTIY